MLQEPKFNLIMVSVVSFMTDVDEDKLSSSASTATHNNHHKQQQLKQIMRKVSSMFMFKPAKLLVLPSPYPFSPK